MHEPPNGRRQEEFSLHTDRPLTPLADKLQQHGAAVVFTKLASEPDRMTAYVQMPADPQEAEECREIIADWNA
ncbi:MAG: hypothetical protein QOF53_3211 [Nocardioidaceae bacterium]|jgi:hypothetical protein|nr:hypothetical protein [Nocardioidaceae bacterium]